MLLRSNILKALLLSASFLLITGCANDEKNDGRSSKLRDRTAASQTAVPASQMISDPQDVQGLKQLTVTVAKTILNKDENTTVKVQALYDDGTSKEMTGKVEWIVTPKDAVSIANDLLVAKKDTHTTIKAKLGNVVSNDVTLDITWTVNGHTLPPEPDPKVNNATLLGVDVNNNGVRDDVERWIYETYKDKRPIYIDIAMQAARGYKLVLEHPEKAKEIHDEVGKAADCEMFYMYDAKYLNETVLVNEEIDSKFFRHKIYFNTKERLDTYIEYDTSLSGDSYTLPTFKEEKQACDFNTSKYEE